MKQVLKPSIKQKLNLNQNVLHSLEFLYLDAQTMQEKISEALTSNPFLEADIPNYDDEPFINQYSTKTSLIDDLRKQLLTVQNRYREDILEYLLLSLNQHGFLSYDKKTYLQDLGIDEQTFLYHLQILQSLEPTGVGAFDSIDSICLQLDKKGYQQASQLMTAYRSLILSMNYTNIKSTLHLSQAEIDQLYTQIRSCNPYPCSHYDTPEDVIHIPDIVITVDKNNITITPHMSIDLTLNYDLYAQVQKDPLMQEYFQSASFLMENLNKRTSTVLRVANELVNIQRGYFLFQDELYPCDLKTLSEACGFHESTISRTLNNKYYLYNNEVYPLKHLLVSKTKSGDSSDSIKKAIVLFISNEDKRSPLSDEDLVSKLEDMDLSCSRRTITKYRKQLSIPSSFKRKIKA